MLKLIFMIAVVGTIVGEINGRTVSTRPPYIGCQSNLECMPGNCCAIGPNKFSIPKCKPLQEEGGVCRPGGEATVNMTLFYPDGSQVDLTEVHYILCPCTYGLSCNTEEGLCRDLSQKRNFNDLLNDASTHDD